ncbi:MAG TPA: winged helix-turn-helix domain-containing protein [Rhizomicrobium sp.]|jgi:Tol biopolymer transport system component/DNA-binding winged helix-turn-helix (wHTH) protein
MNEHLKPPRVPEPIRLSDEPDFSLGNFQVQPSLREVRWGDRREQLEPRVMQVLVALSRAGGAVVSRDDLNERCWDGRIVGEAAINRCISKLRELSDAAGKTSFQIETIPRVGYRLRARDSSPMVAARPSAETASPSVPPRLPRALGWFAAAVVLGVAIAAIIFFRGPSGKWIVVESHQPFITTSQIARWPAFSPDGTMIAYSFGPDIASRKIYLRLRNGGNPIQLTHDALDASSPAWSPDGSTIAYVLAQTGRPCRIMLIPVPAGASRQVGRCRAAERSDVSWDHAGQALFFADSASEDKPQRIWRLDLQSGRAVEFVHPRASARDDDAPSLSPDGQTMLLIRWIGGTIRQIVLHPVSGGAERVLLQSSDDGNGAAWSSDSATVFVTRENRWGSSLWAYPVSGAVPWQITTNAIGMGRIASGPGGLLAMELESIETDLALASATAGQPPRIIDQDLSDVQRISYARDGTLAEIADQSGAMGIWLADPGKPLRPLLQIRTHSAGGFVSTLAWSPDGSKLAWTNVTGDGFIDRVISRGGAPVAQFSVPAFDVGFPYWSADGTSLQQARRDASGWRVWRTEIARPDESVPVSPYGWQFVQKQGMATYGVKTDSMGVWRMDGKPGRVADGPHGYPWRIANDRIVYLDPFDSADTRIMAVPISGGPAVALGYAPGIVSGLVVAVDPRTGQVVYVHRNHQDYNIGWIRLERR